MRRNLIKLTAATALIVSIGACKKDNDNSGGNKSRTELLTQAPWKTVNQEFGNGSSWIVSPDWTNGEACEKDNILTVRTNMTWEETEGATKCDQDDPQIVDNGTWAWQENETKVVIRGETGTVTELNNNTLQITAPLSSSLSIRVTYSH